VDRTCTHSGHNTIALGTLPGSSYAGPSAAFQLFIESGTRSSDYISVYTAQLASTFIAHDAFVPQDASSDGTNASHHFLFCSTEQGELVYVFESKELLETNEC
jgi:hypothetical protein